MKYSERNDNDVYKKKKGGKRNASSRKPRRSKPSSTGTRSTGSETDSSSYADDGSSSNYTNLRGHNDVGWYVFNNENLLKQVAQRSFIYPSGETLEWNGPDDNQLATDAIAGIMRIRFAPTVGGSYDQLSPVNLALRSMFTYVRANVTGNRTYEPVDMMLYYLALDNVYSYWVYMCRIYGMLNRFKLMNSYLPEAWFKSAHLDYDDFVTNAADYLAQINLFRVELSKFPMPKIFHLTDRHTLMLDRLYTDGESNKSQIFYFDPHGFYSYEETTPDKPGYLKWNELPWHATNDSVGTVSDIIAYGREMLDKVNASQDILQIGSDISHVYGRENMRVPTFLTEGTVTGIDRDTEILAQIENCTLVGEPDAGTLDIEQDVSLTVKGGSLIQKPTWTVSEDEYLHAGYTASQLLNLHIPEPTPADVMLGTRLMSILELDKKSGANYILKSKYLASEIIIDFSIWYYYRRERDGAKVLTATNTFDSPILKFDASVDSSEGYNAMMDSLQMVTKISQFDWHPAMWAYVRSKDGSQASLSYRIQDIDNYTMISKNQLDNLNRVAMLSLFGSPTMEF